MKVIIKVKSLKELDSMAAEASLMALQASSFTSYSVVRCLREQVVNSRGVRDGVEKRSQYCVIRVVFLKPSSYSASDSD